MDRPDIKDRTTAGQPVVRAIMANGYDVRLFGTSDHRSDRAVIMRMMYAPPLTAIMCTSGPYLVDGLRRFLTNGFACPAMCVPRTRYHTGHPLLVRLGAHYLCSKRV